MSTEKIVESLDRDISALTSTVNKLCIQIGELVVELKHTRQEAQEQKAEIKEVRTDLKEMSGTVAEVRVLAQKGAEADQVLIDIRKTLVKALIPITLTALGGGLLLFWMVAQDIIKTTP